MHSKEEDELLVTFLKVLESITIIEGPFDFSCAYEYLNNHSQAVLTTAEAIRQYEFVVVILKILVKENLQNYLSPVYISKIISYINRAELEKDWFSVLETSLYLPPRLFYLNTIKYELKQFNVNSSMYVLHLKCLNFHERDVSKCMEVAFDFFSNAINRPISISPQIKWKFFGNPYISISWILVVERRQFDSKFRRELMNESWNDVYGGSSWRPIKEKKSNLLDYLKKLTGYKNEKSGGNNSIKKFISRSSSFFEIDDTVFAKFSDDDSYKRWGILSFGGIAIVLVVFLLIWKFLHYHH